MVHADVAGYSRLIGMNDAGTVRRLRTLRRALIDPAIRAFHGRIVNTAGDSMMIMFDSVDAALQCALRVQQQVPVLDGDQPPERRIRFRIGINLGDVITEGTDVHGDGSNIAARLQNICPVGGICVSRAVRDHGGARLGLEFEPLGPQTLKNIAQPVEAFAIHLDPGASAAVPAVRRRPWKLVLASILTLLLAAGGTARWLESDRSSLVAEAPRAPAPSASASTPVDLGISQAPRLSLVVLPFDNLDGTPEQNSLADGITEDLTTALAQTPIFVVTARDSAFAYKGKAIDIRRVGNELRVRYAVEGSMRKVGTSLRVNVQLISTETGVHLWAYKADADAAAGPSQDDLIWRVSNELNRQLINIEGTRSARERPDDPDAMDLVLQAYVLSGHPWNPQLPHQTIALYERALQLDPSSVEALAGLADTLMSSLSGSSDQAVQDTLDRVETLVSKAESLRPWYFPVIYARGYLLQSEGRLPEAIAAFQNMIELRPNSGLGYHMLGTTLLVAGHPAEAMVNEQRSIELDSRTSGIGYRYRRMAQASLFLGRYDDAVAWAQRAIAAFPLASGRVHPNPYVEIAAAQALAGRGEEAHAAAAEVTRLSPMTTVRTWGAGWNVALANPGFAAQVARVLDALRLAGLRDHADEDANFGVASDQALHTDYEARTPMTVPGARVIRTPDLVQFLPQRKPLVLDVNGWGKSIPGAIALPGAGIGGSTFDSFQARLDRKMQELTHGDRSIPIVTLAWNTDRFSSRNLALRLVALGYTNVIWYRGGREAWKVANLPETEVMVQEW